jgi:secondary thiamine-phosphate synthase enzyme
MLESHRKAPGVKRIDIHTDHREQMVEITDRVAAALASSGVREGVAHVFCAHTTAGITINENADPDVAIDVLAGLERIAPKDAGWRHGEGNADAHLKAVLVGSSVTVPLSQGQLTLGTWQGVFFCEFDGPRDRHVLVSVLEG